MFARVENNRVVEVLDLDRVDDVFTPELVETMHKAPANVGIGWVFAGGKFSPPVVDVELERSLALARVDADAEAARLRYITPGIGQALTYQAKTDEIRRYDADANPTKADYPFLSAEIGITGASLTAVADVVRAALSTWQARGAEIECVRLKAKTELTKADTPARIDGIVSAIEWP